jgi:hypothetical protein
MFTICLGPAALHNSFRLLAGSDPSTDSNDIAAATTTAAGGGGTTASTGSTAIQLSEPAELRLNASGLAGTGAGGVSPAELLTASILVASLTTSLPADEPADLDELELSGRELLLLHQTDTGKPTHGYGLR